MTEETMTEGIAETEPTAPEGAEYWGEEPNTQEVEDPLASLEPLDANLVAPKEEQVTSEPKERLTNKGISIGNHGMTKRQVK